MSPPTLVNAHKAFHYPDTTANVLRREVHGLTEVRAELRREGVRSYHLTLCPWASLATTGERAFPVEKVRVDVHEDGRTFAHPAPDYRMWMHRFPGLLGDRLGHLCLQYPRDPQALRWSWDQGFVTYVTIVHRHLLWEEWARRHGEWPVEDAPHGDAQRNPHPIVTPAMRLKAGFELELP